MKLKSVFTLALIGGTLLLNANAVKIFGIGGFAELVSKNSDAIGRLLDSHSEYVTDLINPEIR